MMTAFSLEGAPDGYVPERDCVVRTRSKLVGCGNSASAHACFTGVRCVDTGAVT